MDRSPPCSSIHGISQVRILEWVAISFSRGSSRARGLPLAHIYWIPVMAAILKTEPWSRGAASSAKVWALEHTALGWSAASLHPSGVAFGKSFHLSESQALTYKMGTMILSISWSWWELNIGKHLVPSMHGCTWSVLPKYNVLHFCNESFGSILSDGWRERSDNEYSWGLELSKDPSSDLPCHCWRTHLSWEKGQWQDGKKGSRK